jgi:hypothetical protein
MCVLNEDLWPPEFSAVAGQAVRRAIADLSHGSPVLAEQTSRWLSLRCDLSQLEDYFIRPQSLPILALPWWLESTIRREVDVGFQTDLMYSSISGYYFARMLDDVMDRHQIQRAAIPALYSFHTQFLSTYFKYFQHSDPFWRKFEKSFMTAAEAAAVEATLEYVCEVEFIEVSARKTTTAVIPIAAVCFHYGRPDLLPSWEELFALLARWHQMRDDLLDWSIDYKLDNRTWVLSEAERRRADGESVAEWMGREGLKWGQSVMECWINEAVTMASGLGSPTLVRYLKLRKESFSSYLDTLIAIAVGFAKLLQLGPSPSI